MSDFVDPIFVASAVVVGFGLFLFTFAISIWIRRELAERFILSFASSLRAHLVEQAIRLVFGVSLLASSPAMWQPALFRIVGWTIVATSVGLVLIPWRWHHRFAQWVLPPVVRHMRLYSVALIGFGVLLLYGFYAGDFPGTG